MATLVKTDVTYGGRFLYTVQQKQNGHMFIVNVQRANDVSHAAVVAFHRKEQALRFAYTLEKVPELNTPQLCDTVDFGWVDTLNTLPIEDIALTSLYVDKWDGYHLHSLVTRHHFDLLVIQNTPKLYPCSSDPKEYIDIFNALYSDT